MGMLRELVDLLLRLFALGLFINIILNWLLDHPPTGPRKRLNQAYEYFLKPIRRYVKPLKLSPSAPAGLDLSPLILLLLVWWAIHPFLLWVLGG